MSIFTTAETDIEALWAELEAYFSADVWPIVKQTLLLIEKGGAEALLNAATAAVTAVSAGTPFAEIVTAVEGTLTNSGVAIVENAAATAIQLVKNMIEPSAPVPAVVPPAAA